MKKIFILFFLVLSTLSSATTYYVSTTGSNSYPGTISQPFLTIQYGIDHLTSAGDILYIRGGIYSPGGSIGVSVSASNASGTAGNTIKVHNYPGETVILDGSNFSGTGAHFGFYVKYANYWHFKGINIRNNPGFNNGSNYGVGFQLYNCSNVLIELCNVYSSGGGFTMDGTCDYITYLNCDAYDNEDLLAPPETPGDYANGFSAHVHGTAHITYEGCRAWHNSDDGFDVYGSSGYITLNKCWAFNNGYGQGGNGAGIKTGANDTYTESGVQRTITNCLSFNNLTFGFDKSQDGGPAMLHYIYNNVAYNNGEVGFNFQKTGSADIFRNNIAYNNKAGFWPLNSGSIVDHNNFSRSSENSNITVSNADFLSVDPAGTSGARQADGSLPVINFLNLAKGSRLIDAGVDVSLPYSGSAPDVGAFESQTSTAPANPAYLGSTVENATPSVIEMAYSSSLALIIPPSSAFGVKVNSVVRTVNIVTISGTKVLLTLANPVVSSDVITVTYTKPATNSLQTASGGFAATLSAQTVTNNVSQGSLPVYVSSAIENATPTSLEMTYSLSLANVVPSVSAFSVKVNSVAIIINAVAISGTKVLLTLATPVVYNDVITVSYTKPSSRPIQTASGELAATLSAQAVTNKVSSSPALSYINSAIGNSSPSLLEINYNLPLANVLPSVSAFNVRVNSVLRHVNSIAISGSSVILTLASEAFYGDEVTVAYIKPASKPLQSTTGLQAATMIAQSVTNKIDGVGPIYLSSTIENTTPNILEINYNETLDITVPAVSSFIVTANGINRIVTSVSISGTKVLLTLAKQVVYGDIVTVSYTKPSSNQLKKALGGPAISLGPQRVINKVIDLAANPLKEWNISIYPNPARDYINVSKMDASSESKIIRIFDFAGRLFSETMLNPNISDIRIPINLKTGIYIVQVSMNSLILFSQELFVSN